jgi:hypothetical protein
MEQYKNFSNNSKTNYLKYLYLIPIQTDYNNWLKVGMAIAGAGGCEDDFKKWCLLGDYKPNEWIIFKTFKKSYKINKTKFFYKTFFF